MLAIPLALLGVVVTPPCLSRFHAGAPSTQRHCTPHLGIGDFFQKLGEELDNFADDATMRRMGNGAKFYGKRKSSFYGEEDSERKKDPQVANPDEDWRGPAGGSFFVISKERDEEGRPLKFLTRKEAREEERREEEEKWEAAKRAQEMSTAFERAVRGENGEEMKL